MLREVINSGTRRLAVALVATAALTLTLLAASSSAVGTAAPVGTEMVRDLVCNTFVPKARALRATIGGDDRGARSPADAEQSERRFTRDATTNPVAGGGFEPPTSRL